VRWITLARVVPAAGIVRFAFTDPSASGLHSRAALETGRPFCYRRTRRSAGRADAACFRSCNSRQQRLNCFMKVTSSSPTRWTVWKPRDGEPSRILSPESHSTSNSGSCGATAYLFMALRLCNTAFELSMVVGPLSFPAEKLKLGGVAFTREADFETDEAIGGDFEACRLQLFGVEPLAQSAHSIAVTHVQRLRHEYRAGRAPARYLVRNFRRQGCRTSPLQASGTIPPLNIARMPTK
jgi:hypothetical protein